MNVSCWWAYFFLFQLYMNMKLLSSFNHESEQVIKIKIRNLSVILNQCNLIMMIQCLIDMKIFLRLNYTFFKPLKFIVNIMIDLWKLFQNYSKNIVFEMNRKNVNWSFWRIWKTKIECLREHCVKLFHFHVTLSWNESKPVCSLRALIMTCIERIVFSIFMEKVSLKSLKLFLQLF